MPSRLSASSPHAGEGVRYGCEDLELQVLQDRQGWVRTEVSKRYQPDLDEENLLRIPHHQGTGPQACGISSD